MASMSTAHQVLQKLYDLAGGERNQLVPRAELVAATDLAKDEVDEALLRRAERGFVRTD